jgi:thioredoxin-like negative regulator of GroEL
MFGPIYEKVSAQYPDITFAKVDTEAEREIAAAAGITSIPTLMAFRDGILLYREAGSLPEQSLQKLVAQVTSLDMDEIRAEIAKEAAQVSNK